MSHSLTEALQGQPGYKAFLQGIKDRIRRTQIGAALAANRELILLYWDIGREILDRQREEGWGAKVVDQLAVDLHRAFPELKGLSARNLKYMRAFAEALGGPGICATSCCTNTLGAYGPFDGISKRGKTT